jgi:hypothetical protein
MSMRMENGDNWGRKRDNNIDPRAAGEPDASFSSLPLFLPLLSFLRFFFLSLLPLFSSSCCIT